MITWQQWIILFVLLFLVATFAVGGIMLGAWFNYITTGVWFI